jgi:hypothetical protein
MRPIFDLDTSIMIAEAPKRTWALWQQSANDGIENEKADAR